MRILLVCHYFPPEIGAPQARLSEMGRRWATNGDNVQVLTGFPNHPTGVIPPQYRGRHSMSETMDGCDVVRTWLYATPNEGIIKKTLGHLSFMASGVVLGWRKVRRPDVVVVSSPTFFSILTALVQARRFRVPFVVEVRDLWPAIFVELGVLKNRWIIGLLERLELAAYRVADHVVVVSDGFRRNLIERGVPAEKVTVITNGVDVDRFAPEPADPAVRTQLGATGDQPLVVYAGAHGISHGLEALLDAARLLPAVQFTLVGEGARKTNLLKSAESLPNVTFLDGVPRHEVPVLLHAADILVVPLRDVPLFSTFIPSKMFEFLASGTAVVGALTGEAAEILANSGAMVVPPEQPDQLAQAIEALVDDPEDRRRRADQGRTFVEENYSRDVLADRYQALLRETVAGRPVTGETTGSEPVARVTTEGATTDTTVRDPHQ